MNSAILEIHTPITPELIHGAVEVEYTAAGVLPHRLPAWARAQWQDGQLAMAEAQPSGVRLVFETAASAIELVALPTRRVYAGMPARPDGVYELCIGGRVVGQASAAGGNVLNIDLGAGSAAIVPGAPQTLRFAGLPAGRKAVEIWLPHDEKTELVALRSDAPILPILPVGAARRRRWLHHGSSISQGSNASHPTGTWPAVAAARAGVELLNLGFSGSALLDPFVARTLRDLPADLLSLKIGINLVNTDLMRLRAFGPAVHGFLDTLREGHPATPLLVVSPVYCPIHEETPGPSLPDASALAEGRLMFRAAGHADEVRSGKLTLGLIRAQLQAIVRQRREQGRDRNIHYLDGSALYGIDDNARLPLPDALHPDTAAHRLMGERFADLAFGDGPFARDGGSSRK
jgi:hypothetical protein